MPSYIRPLVLITPAREARDVQTAPESKRRLGCCQRAPGPQLGDPRPRAGLQALALVLHLWLSADSPPHPRPPGVCAPPCACPVHQTPTLSVTPSATPSGRSPGAVPPPYQPYPHVALVPFRFSCPLGSHTFLISGEGANYLADPRCPVSAGLSGFASGNRPNTRVCSRAAACWCLQSPQLWLGITAPNTSRAEETLDNRLCLFVAVSADESERKTQFMLWCRRQGCTKSWLGSSLVVPWPCPLVSTISPPTQSLVFPGRLEQPGTLLKARRSPLSELTLIPVHVPRPGCVASAFL